MVYLIIYECLSVEHNFCVTEEIKALSKDYQHPASNTWFIVSELSLSEINEKLSAKIVSPNKERLMVIQITSSVEYKGCMPKAMWRWLNRNLK